MKILQKKPLLLAIALIAGLMGAGATLAATVTVPTPNVLNGNNNWHCTATDNAGKHWSDEGRDYNAARQNALDRCEKHSSRSRTCEVRRGDCNH